jgi:threonine/homoserine/homoserine lactone efflux protein
LCEITVLDLTEGSVWTFFGVTVVISLTGVLTPGPVFAATVAKSYKDERAGLKIALGHGLVEFPLMALIVLSLGYVFTNDYVKLGIGLVAGVLLVFMGVGMIRSRKTVAEEGLEYVPKNSVLAGALTTSANPYFLLWWATVGAALITSAQYYGAIVVVIFAVVHWSCDLAWYTFTGFAVFRSRKLWTPVVHEIVFGVCGALMIGFGLYFIAGPTIELTS